MAQTASLLVRLQADISSYESAMNKAISILSNIKKNFNSLSNTFSSVSQKMDKLGKKMEDISKKTEKASKSMEKTGKGMTKYVTTPLTLFGGLSIKVAGDYESALNQINRTLGESSSILTDFATNNALAFNMSEKAAVKYGAVYSNLLSSFIPEQEDNAKLTESLLKQSAVIASWTGRSIEDVMERIRSGLLGNTEAIEDLGINVNVAMLESTETFKKFANGKSWNQLDFQTQQLIRLFSILEQSADAYGEKLNETKTGSLAKMKALIEDVAKALGDILLPVIDELVQKYINPVLTWLKNLSPEGKKTVATFLLIAAAIGPVLIFVSKLLSAFSKLPSMFSALKVGFGGLSKAFSFLAAHPVVAAILAIVAVLIYLYNTNENVRNAIQNAWEGFKQFFGILVQKFKQYIMQYIEGLQNAWDSIVVVVTAIVDIFTEWFGYLKALFTGDWKAMWEHAKNMVKTAVGAIIVVVLNLVDNILIAFQRLSEILLDKIFVGIAKGFQDMINGLLKGWNWVADKFGWKKVGLLEIDFEAYVPSKLIQQTRDELKEIAEKWRGGEKAELPFSFGKSKVKKTDVPTVSQPKMPDFNTNSTFDNLDMTFSNIGETAESAKNGVDKLADSVKNLVQSIRQQTESFRDALGMFDTFERKVISPERLLNRMKAQVKAMSQWTSALATLSNRGINQSFLNELRAMGPQNVDYIRALAQMSDEQLAQYQALYGQKYNIAQREAERMVTTEQKIEKYVEQEITIQISGNKISSDDDVDRIAKEIVRKLKLKGV